MFLPNFSLINSIWGQLLDFINDFIVEPIVDFAIFLLGFMMRPIYLLFLGMCKLLDFFQVVIRKLAGMDVIYLNGEAHTGDITLTLIRQEIIWNTFTSMLALAIILLFVTTFMSVLRTQFQSGQKASIMFAIGNAFRSIISFSLVPMFCFIGIYFGNILLSTLDQATASYNATTMSSQIFVVAAYDANNGRDYGSSFYEKYLKPDCGTTKNNFGIFLDSNGKNIAGAAIDNAFANNLIVKATEEDVDVSLLHTLFLGSPFAGPASMLGPYSLFLTQDKTQLEFSIYNVSLVYMYYNMGKFNFLLGIGAAAMVLYVFLGMFMGLIKRMYMIVTLFVVSPPLIALYPLDEGRSMGGWKQQFVSNVLSAYAAIVSLNIYMSLMGVFQQVELFSADSASAAISADEISYVSADDASTLYNNHLTKTIANVGVGFANMLAQLFMIIGGAVYFREFTARLSGLIGADDAFSAGNGVVQKVAKSAVGVATTAVAGAKIAGAAMKAKAGAVSDAVKAGQKRKNSLRDVGAANAAANKEHDEKVAAINAKAENGQLTEHQKEYLTKKADMLRDKKIAEAQGLGEESEERISPANSNIIAEQDSLANSGSSGSSSVSSSSVSTESRKESIKKSGASILKHAAVFAATGGMSGIVSAGMAINKASEKVNAVSGTGLRASGLVGKYKQHKYGVTAEQLAQIEKTYRDDRAKAFEMNAVKNPMLYRMKLKSEKRMNDKLYSGLDEKGADQVKEAFGRRDAIHERTRELKRDVSLAKETGDREMIEDTQKRLGEYLTSVKNGLARNDAYWLQEAEFQKFTMESLNRIKALEAQAKNAPNKQSLEEINRQIRDVKNALSQVVRPKP